MVLAYADDLTTNEDYAKVLKWVYSWKTKINLQINEQNTKESRIGKFSKIKGRYESVNCFTYLCVNIHKLYRTKSSKKHCINVIRNSARLYSLCIM